LVINIESILYHVYAVTPLLWVSLTHNDYGENSFTYPFSLDLLVGSYYDQVK